MKRGLLVVLLLCALAPQAHARDLQTVSRTFRAGGIRDLYVDFSAGALEVRGAPGDSVVATMTARCDGDANYSECAERAARVRLVSDVRGGTLHLKLEGVPKTRSRGFSVGLVLEVPSSLALALHVGVGEVEVRGMGHDVAVEMGVGNATVHQAERAVRSVKVTVGVGDATLNRSHQRIEGRGFVGKSLRWHDGEGAARIQVELGVGEVSVGLDPAREE
jgi:hypothetical protein